MNESASHRVRLMMSEPRAARTDLRVRLAMQDPHRGEGSWEERPAKDIQQVVEEKVARIQNRENVFDHAEQQDNAMCNWTGISAHNHRAAILPPPPPRSVPSSQRRRGCGGVASPTGVTKTDIQLCLTLACHLVKRTHRSWHMFDRSLPPFLSQSATGSRESVSEVQQMQREPNHWRIILHV